MTSPLVRINTWPWAWLAVRVLNSVVKGTPSRCIVKLGTLVNAYVIEGYSLSILRKKARIAINPIGRVRNLRKRSATKKSALIMLGKSDVLIPIRVNTPIIIKPTTGSPMITETRIVLSSHHGPPSSPSARAITRQLGPLLSSIFPALAPLCGMNKQGYGIRHMYHRGTSCREYDDRG